MNVNVIVIKPDVDEVETERDDLNNDYCCDSCRYYAGIFEKIYVLIKYQ